MKGKCLAEADVSDVIKKYHQPQNPDNAAKRERKRMTALVCEARRAGARFDFIKQDQKSGQIAKEHDLKR